VPFALIHTLAKFGLYLISALITCRYDLGTLYESCNNQIQDAIDAYSRAAELDQNNPQITQRLNYLKQQQANGCVPIYLPHFKANYRELSWIAATSGSRC
jgi:hypothetical protein